MPGAQSPGEIAATVVVGLIHLDGKREHLVPDLSAVVRQVVDELDPDHQRNTDPTWYADLPSWHHLDGLDRIRRAHDQLVVLEAQAGEVVQDLQGLLALAEIGSLTRPHGYTPGRALSLLMTMASRRAEMLSDMGRAERLVNPRLAKTTSRGLRQCLRTLTCEEVRAQQERVRLAELLTPPAPALAG